MESKSRSTSPQTQQDNKQLLFLQYSMTGLALIILLTTVIQGNIRAKSTQAILSVLASPYPSPIITPSPTPAPSPSPSPVPLTRDLKIPILMYHYIRDYENNRDRIGTNLSVSPTVFSQQLATLKTAGYTAVTFADITSGNIPTKPIIITFDDGYDDAYSAALPALQAQQMKGVFYVVSDFLNRARYITTDQMKALDSAGMEVGSHTIDHRNLANMDHVAQERQLRESKASLEALLGKPVTAFCYPAGQYNATTTRLAKSIGYTTSTTTKSGVATGANFIDTPHELVRIRVTNNTDILKALKEKQ